MIKITWQNACHGKVRSVRAWLLLVKITQVAAGTDINYARSASVLFAYDRSDAQAIDTQVGTLEEIAQAIRETSTTNPVIVSGFTDEVGSYVYNQELSSERANTVARLLVEQGIAAQRIELHAK